MRHNIVIAGCAASGKDYLKSKLIQKGYIPSISDTTRPSRSNEVNGIDYNFISEDEFLVNIDSKNYLEYCNFNGWYYGTKIQKNQKPEPNIYIMTPSGIAQLPDFFRESSLIIYLDIHEEVRLERLKSRNDSNDSLMRRLQSDRNDFLNFTDWDIRITKSEDINL